jgi:hypothetical protein
MGAAGALSCPKCGATVDPEITRCPYCEARLATVACPSCFAKIFRGFSNCPYCGVEAEREAVAVTGRRCPKCESKPKLVQVRIGETLVEECGRCAGLWVEHRTFERLQNDKEEHATILGMPAPESARANEAVRYVPCPSCGELMNRLNFARCSGVIIDTCKKDGIWFDADELRQIVAFIEGGGLVKARDRELEKLRAEKQALNSTMRQLELERRQDAYRGVASPLAGAGWSSPSGAIATLSVLRIVGGVIRLFFG